MERDPQDSSSHVDQETHKIIKEMKEVCMFYYNHSSSTC